MSKTGMLEELAKLTAEERYEVSLRLPVPPLPIQQRFADIVRDHERLRATQRESFRQTEHLFQSLLRQSFAEVV